MHSQKPLKPLIRLSEIFETSKSTLRKLHVCCINLLRTAPETAERQLDLRYQKVYHVSILVLDVLSHQSSLRACSTYLRRAYDTLRVTCASLVRTRGAHMTRRLSLFLCNYKRNIFASDSTRKTRLPGSGMWVFQFSVGCQSGNLAVSAMKKV